MSLRDTFVELARSRAPKTVREHVVRRVEEGSPMGLAGTPASYEELLHSVLVPLAAERLAAADLLKLARVGS